MLEFITTFSLTNSRLTVLKACAPPDEDSNVQGCLMLKFGSVRVVKTLFAESYCSYFTL